MSSIDQKPAARRVAIIGGGVSGLSSAYFLDDVDGIQATLFEAEHRLGGNAVTVKVRSVDGHSHATDPVVYLFLTQRYPLFTAWLRQLQVKTHSFNFENFFYDGYRRRSVLISNRLGRILRSPGFSLTYLRDIYSFKRIMKTIREMDDKGELSDDLSMREFESRVTGVRPGFFGEVFYPLMSFAFHCDPGQLPSRPCGPTLRSYASVAKAPDAAYCIDGGVARYVDEVRGRLQSTRVVMDGPVISVKRNSSKGHWDVVSTQGVEQGFNDVIFAIWPSQVEKILGEYATHAGGQWRELVNALSQVKQAWCRATVHDDAATMPKRRRDWATYCYRHLPMVEHVTATIWSGQVAKLPIFTTYDWASASSRIPATHVAGVTQAVNVHFRTPPDEQLYAVRNMVRQQQGTDGLWFAGSYLKGTGFHEDGLASALEVVQQLEPSARHSPRLKTLLEASAGPL